MKHPFLEFKLKEPTNKKYKPKKCSTLLKHFFAKHANSKAPQEHELELMGLLDMVGGIEYHHKNFLRIEKDCHKIYKKTFEEMIFYSIPSKNAIHEMVAYLNRLGQISSLFTSGWFKKYVRKSDLAVLCPTILALTPLRNKFASHRSIDKSKNESSSQLANHASLPFGLRWIGTASSNTNPFVWDMNTNIGYQINISKHEKLNRSLILEKYHSSPVDKVEIFTKNEIWITFIPTKHHNKICNEILSVMKKFFQEITP